MIKDELIQASREVIEKYRKYVNAEQDHIEQSLPGFVEITSFDKLVEAKREWSEAEIKWKEVSLRYSHSQRKKLN